MSNNFIFSKVRAQFGNRGLKTLNEHSYLEFYLNAQKLTCSFVRLKDGDLSEQRENTV